MEAVDSEQSLLTTHEFRTASTSQSGMASLAGTCSISRSLIDTLLMLHPVSKAAS
jgi:hypothetical protein